MEPKNVHLLNVKRAKGDTPRPRILDYLDAARANLAQLEAWRKQHKIDYAECAEQRDAALREVEHLKLDGEKQIDAVRDQLGQLQARQRQYVVDYAECEKQRDTALRDRDRSNEDAAQKRLLLEEYDSIIEAQSKLIEELRAQNLREPNDRARRDPGESLEESRPSLTILALERHERRHEGQHEGRHEGPPSNPEPAVADRGSAASGSLTIKPTRLRGLIGRMFDFH
jgi:hypothetical protein